MVAERKTFFMRVGPELTGRTEGFSPLLIRAACKSAASLLRRVREPKVERKAITFGTLAELVAKKLTSLAYTATKLRFLG